MSAPRDRFLRMNRGALALMAALVAAALGLMQLDSIGGLLVRDELAALLVAAAIVLSWSFRVRVSEAVARRMELAEPPGATRTRRVVLLALGGAVIVRGALLSFDERYGSLSGPLSELVLLFAFTALTAIDAPATKRSERWRARSSGVTSR